MNEEIKKKIEEEAEELYPFTDSYLEFNGRQALRQEGFIAGAEYGYNLANQWVSVKDRLPEGDEYGTVIGWSVKFGNPDRSAGGFMVLVYFDNCWRKDSDDSDYEDNPDYQKITHWMLLLSSPKEK